MTGEIKVVIVSTFNLMLSLIITEYIYSDI